MPVRDPMYLVIQGLESFLKNTFGDTFKIWAEWPGEDLIKTELPCIAISEISETGTEKSPKNKIYQTSDNGDGTSKIQYEVFRFDYLFQISLFTKTKSDRRYYGSLLVQELLRVKRIPLPDGEYSLITSYSKQDDVGESNFYPRHITLNMIGRLLLEDNSYNVGTVEINKEVN